MALPFTTFLLPSISSKALFTLCIFSLSSILKSILIFPPCSKMAPKIKTQKTAEEENPSTTLLDLDHLPLVDSLFKVTDYECKFDFHELILWIKKKNTDK